VGQFSDGGRAQTFRSASESICLSSEIRYPGAQQGAFFLQLPETAEFTHPEMRILLFQV
jgi:hypothetical protein